MAAITASMVGELRAKTDAPMMECKKALTEADGNMEKAEELLRIKLGNKAGKASARVTAEGVVAAYVDGNIESGQEVLIAKTGIENEQVTVARSRFARVETGRDGHCRE